jgi:hypothetical protein
MVGTRKVRTPIFSVLTICVLTVCARAQVHYDLTVRVDNRAHTVDGVARITIENRGARPLDTLWLWRFPERLAERSPALNDYNFYWIYPYRFNPGGMRTGAVTVDGRAQSVEVVDHPRAGRGTLLRVTLDRPIAPGARAELAVEFQTRVPERYGRFGCFRATCVLDGGFYPMLAAGGAAGDAGPDLDAPPARASYRVTLSVPRPSDAIINGELRAVASTRPLTVELGESRHLALVVGPPRLRTIETEHRGVRIVLYTASFAPPPPSPDGAILPYLPPDRGGHMIRTAQESIDLLAELGRPLPESVRLYEGALRVEVAESLPGFTLVSDQAFAIFPLQRFLKFHEFELARAIYAGVAEARAASGSERRDDLGWAPEVAAGWLVDAYTVRSFQREEWAGQILRVWGFIPAIDRIIYAPQVPFASAYFYTLEDPDPLRDSLAQFNNARPRGRLIYAKLRDVAGDDGIGVIVRRQLDGAPLRQIAADVTRQPLDWFFTQWLGPYPAVDYRITSVKTDLVEGKQWRHLITVEKRGDDPPVEPVELRVRDRQGHTATRSWDGRGRTHTFVFVELGPKLRTVELDPRGRLVENLPGANDDLRFDDRRPPRWKFVYNNFGGLVTLFPTFGLDLSLNFSLAPILDIKNSYSFIIYHSIATQIGVSFSYARSFGRKITAARLSQDVGASVTVRRLDPQFGFPINCPPKMTCSNPGTGLALSVGWGYDDRLFVWEPQRANTFGVGVGYGLIALDSGRALSQVTVSASGEIIRRIADGHGIAASLVGGITFGDLQLPQQMQFAGGAGGLRGYAIDELAGRAVIFGRVEYRHVFVHSLDWNLLHVLYVRGIGGGLFAEGAAFSNCGSYAMRPEGLAADVGYTLRIFGDWLGVSQTTLNIDLGVPLVHETRACFGNTYTTGTRAPIGFFFAFGPPW